MKKLVLMAVVLLSMGTVFSCREQKKEEKEVIIKEDVEEENEGLLERAGKEVDEEVNEEVEEEIDKIGDDN